MKRMRNMLAMLLFASASLNVLAETKLKIITTNGAVGFTVDDDWAVLNMQSKLPVAAAVFQIPNKADSQTPDSTNLIFKLYDLNTDTGRAAFEAPVKQYGSDAPKQEVFGAWTLYRQQALQGTTTYTILDAKRVGVADVSATARIAWPHLKKNAKKYDAQLESRFQKFLNSVYGETGSYKPQENEVVRRPAE